MEFLSPEKWSLADEECIRKPVILSLEFLSFLIEVCNKNLFSYFSTKIYVDGIQKNRLNETVLLSTKNMLRLVDKKIN